MSDLPTRREGLFAGLAGVAGVAGSYAVAGDTRSFVVAPIDALVVDATPGQIVAWLIDNVGEPAHLLHVSLSLALAVGLLGAASLAGLLVARRVGRPFVGVGLAGLLGWGVTAAITLTPLLAVGPVVPVALFTAVGTAPTPPDHDPTRRRVLGSVTGVLGAVAGAYWLGGLRTGDGTSPPADGSPASDDEVDEGVARLRREADRKSLDLAGDVPGLVSTFDEFYLTDIAQFDPELPADDWTLTLTGEVREELTVTFEELTDMPTEHRFVTLRCVGEPLNGHKLDNAVWTGTPIEPLLEAADPDGECGCAMLHAEDGYHVQFPVTALEDGFLAWRMNGEPLPRSHGHPVRVLVPGHWGETNVKWLSEVELLDEAADGYWEERGWHGTGPVNTVAKLWSDTRLDDGRIEVAGHAYAGTRGVEGVEVSTDGGDTWTDADLSEPLPGEDVWRQWRYAFEPDGSHEVVVRAVDGEGTVQPGERSESFPSGPTGWVSRTVGE